MTKLPERNLPNLRRLSKGEARQATLERWQAIASIASSIAIPIVVAAVGYFVQKRLADEGLKKDYVAIATGVLKDDSTKQSPEFRQWAVTTLAANSPIPFPESVKKDLERIYISPTIPFPPKGCMRSPAPRRIGPLLMKFEKSELKSYLDVINQYNELLGVAVTAEAEAMEDRAALECLQNWSAYLAKSTDASKKLEVKQHK